MNTSEFLRKTVCVVALVSTAMVPCVFMACSTVPLTGRSQLSLISSAQMLSMSEAAYGDFLKSSKPSADAQASTMVKRVGSRIQGAVERHFKENQLEESLAGYQWEFNLVESADANAWCMPGGKVVIFTGILPLTKNEAGLAAVMGHEIAHAIAEHGRERMSQSMLAQLGMVAIDAALEEKPDETREMLMGAFGIGVQLGVLLPFSRLHESEADELGLTFMAIAGYNPQEAVSFWQRMAAKPGGQATPEFFSTHPSDETRIRQLHALMPAAMKHYKPAKSP
ncbi:MAG: M48 family peptidase [Planctomycetes bacterium]|nr:M48 family peptidase [Planctomycetota bacterium]